MLTGAAVAEAAICCGDNTPPASPASRPARRPVVIEASASNGDAARAVAKDADGLSAWFLPVLCPDAEPGPTPLPACRDALLPARLAELAELPLDGDPARPSSARPLSVEGAPAEGESSACAIPGVPPSRAAPTAMVTAAGPSHEYGWRAVRFPCRRRRPREFSMLFVAIGPAPRLTSERQPRRGQKGIKDRRLARDSPSLPKPSRIATVPGLLERTPKPAPRRFSSLNNSAVAPLSVRCARGGEAVIGISGWLSREPGFAAAGCRRSWVVVALPVAGCAPTQRVAPC